MTMQSFKSINEMQPYDWLSAGMEKWVFEDSEGNARKVAGLSEDMNNVFFEGLFTRCFNCQGKCVVPEGDNFHIVKRIS